METREITVFEFDELSDQAKEAARDWFRAGNLDYDWWDSVYEDAQRIGKIIGIDIKPRCKNNPKSIDVPCIWFSGFSSQGDGASFEGYYSYKPDACAKLQEYAPSDPDLRNIVESLEEVQAKHSGQVTATIEQSGRYYHEMTMQIDVSVDGEDADFETEETIKEAMRDFARWIYSSLEQQHDWLQSDESVDESIRANEYRFEENGEVV